MSSINPLSTSVYTNSVSALASNKGVKESNNDTPLESNKLSFFSSAQETMQTLGKSVLGKDNIADWEAKGLKIDDKTIELAYEQMSLGLQELGGKAGKVSFNSHQIVKSLQDVPEWFNEEQQKAIESIQDPVVQERFQAGELFASTLAINPSKHKSVDSYISIYNS
jgi:hypothetical protein